jgi:hypothetical protein
MYVYSLTTAGTLYVADSAYSFKRIPHARHVDLTSNLLTTEDVVFALSLAAIVNRDDELIHNSKHL